MSSAVTMFFRALREAPALFFGRSTVASETASPATDNWLRPLLKNRYVRVIGEWLSHVVVLIVILSSIQLVEYALTFLDVTNEKMFFGVIPIKWIFDGADIAALFAVGLNGVVAALRVFFFRDRPDS
jgi:hypothetical protein